MVIVDYEDERMQDCPFCFEPFGKCDCGLDIDEIDAEPESL